MSADQDPPPAQRSRRAAGDSVPAWERASRYDRRAQVIAVEHLTETGTVKITFRILDDRPFSYLPGYWVGIEEDVPGFGRYHSPYCVMSPPGDTASGKERRFDILPRIIAQRPLARHLGSHQPGDIVRFRGPSGRSMLPRETDSDLVLIATGVGISPLICLARHLLSEGDRRRIRLFWGLRLTDDICLLEILDALVARHDNFSYEISLSQPPPRWPQLYGRVTESVPPLLEKLGGTRFCLSGNGAMVEEMETALSTMGVDRTFVHGERFFNIRHRPDPATMQAIVGRFVARDLRAGLRDLDDLPSIFPLHRDVHGRVVGPTQEGSE